MKKVYVTPDILSFMNLECQPVLQRFSTQINSTGGTSVKVFNEGNEELEKEGVAGANDGNYDDYYGDIEE